MKRRWTPSEVETAIKLFKENITYNGISKCLIRTRLAVRGKLNQLGYKRFIPKNDPKTRRFVKGQIPWNAGKIGVHYSPNTEFRKGDLPHNTKLDGTISLRHHRGHTEYLWIKIADKTWVQLHRYLYERYIGKIPDGKIVIFRDGNQLNTNLDNLELIDKGILIRRNHNFTKAHNTRIINCFGGNKELQELKYLQLELQRSLDNVNR